MRRASWIVGGGAAIAGILSAVACGSSSSGGSGDDSSIPSDAGADTSLTDTGPRPDAAATEAGTPEAGPEFFCTTSPCAVSLAVGGRHSCAVLSDHTVRCWGLNQYGEIGFGTVDGGGVTPFLVAPPATAATGVTGAKAVGAGDFNDNEQFGFSCALLQDAGVDCWGVNTGGELGRADSGVIASVDPVAAPVALGFGATQISTGAIASCALAPSGDLYCWGYNVFGIVNPATSAAAAPTLLVAPTKFTQVSVGSLSACAVSEDSHVWCWGYSSSGATGNNSDGGAVGVVVHELAGLQNIVEIATSYAAGCALNDLGAVLCWGGPPQVLGRGGTDSGVFDPNPAPVVMPTGVKFTQIVAHYTGYCALDDSKNVWCWGENTDGAEGIDDGGGTLPVLQPEQVPGLANVDQLATGNGGGIHMCALIHGGTVKCWGLNSSEQLGTALVDGGAISSTTPVTVTF